MLRHRLRITGQVQGVGFRPFVYRLANELGLAGWVNNDSLGVTVEVQGSAEALAMFSRRLGEELPPLASIDSCERGDAPVVAGEESFVIRPSEQGELATAQVTVDTAVCDDCLREMRDERDPRFAYPFINCTNCGPRYTIVRRIPYDRPNTTMASFVMCPLCRGEYDDPRSRRFHAQPIACPQCGPRLWLTDPRGKAIAAADPVAFAAELLAAGKILAIKGLGGFHIACRADNDHVVRRLRRRKHRDAKPLALMVADLDRAARLVQLDPHSRELLTGPVRPIVLLPAEREGSVAPSVAQGLGTLGIMLPYTPLHHLLFAQKCLADQPLVMTSGNYSDEPLVKDNDAAIAHLSGLADAMLLHDRDIERRLDDSVVQMHPGSRYNVLRRARGYAPAPVRLNEGATATSAWQCNDAGPDTAEKTRQWHPNLRLCPSLKSRNILAVGPELKNTFCLLGGGRAILSEHIGDLKEARAYRHFIDTINHLEALFEIRPELLAADLHSQYLSTEYAMRRHRGLLPGKPALPIIRVQHHHAHIVACMAENGCAGPVIGLACDGVGLGDDGAVWGCEILRTELAGYRRLGHLRYTPMPGGDAAALETARPALAALWDAFAGEIFDMPLAKCLAGGEQALASIVQMLEAKVNCPPSSSLGRWFDAAAALCGIAAHNDFEGQAPMLLEGAIAPGVENHYDFKIVTPAADSPFQIDLRPMTAQLVADVTAGIDTGIVAARFHNTVVEFLFRAVQKARELTSIATIALSGGCFANRYLLSRLAARLRRADFDVLLHRDTPVNDGCVALGQAMAAAARAIEGVNG